MRNREEEYNRDGADCYASLVLFITATRLFTAAVFISSFARWRSGGGGGVLLVAVLGPDADDGEDAEDAHHHVEHQGLVPHHAVHHGQGGQDPAERYSLGSITSVLLSGDI